LFIVIFEIPAHLSYRLYFYLFLNHFAKSAANPPADAAEAAASVAAPMHAGHIGQFS